LVKVLERGDIFFLYRPRVGVERVRGLDDVQRLVVILKPAGRQRFRYLVIGRKRLPEPDEHERVWGFVDLVGESAVDLEDELDPQEYETRTRGRRRQAPARPAGEGVYVIAPHNGHTHLAYALELPERLGPVQHELNIGQDVSLIAAVRNPDADGWPHVRRPAYPPDLRERFGDRRFVPLEPPDFLDYPGTELVLIGASRDPEGELDVDLSPKRETEETADVITELKLERDIHPLRPLLTGEWE
jgi:hypothetical protein